MKGEDTLSYKALIRVQFFLGMNKDASLKK